MRKYAMPKGLICVIMLLLLCVTFGSTYAYFSASVDVSANVELGKIDMVWLDINNSKLMKDEFDNPSTTDINEACTIAIAGQLSRGDYVPIQAKDINGQTKDVKLQISNMNATVQAYCRVKITAKYTPLNSETEVDCSHEHLKFALNLNGIKTPLESLGLWFYDQGYYYLGRLDEDDEGNPIKTLTALSVGGGVMFADYIYLSENANPNILGSSMKIMLTLEGVQTTHDAYKSVWGVSW